MGSLGRRPTASLLAGGQCALAKGAVSCFTRVKQHAATRFRSLAHSLSGGMLRLLSCEAPSQVGDFMPNFVEFDRQDSHAVPDEPMFTLQKRGLISMNMAAFKALGEPVSVALLYDADEG